MLQFIGRRLLISIPMVFIVTFLVFVLVDFAPGDPARTIAGDFASPDRIAEIRSNLHLADPLPTRYARWVGNAVQGDLGVSYIRNREVTGLIKEKLAVTLPGFLPGARAIDVTAARTAGGTTVRDVRIELQRGALIGGTVRDSRGQRVGGAIVRVVPLKGGTAYEPLGAGMRAALPYVDRFVAGHNVASLDELGRLVAGIRRRHEA